MVDATDIGRAFAAYSADVEAGRLRLFAKATGETRAEYLDEAAARVAGHPALPAPPTFALCVSLEKPDPFDWLREIGVDLARVLHSGESFRYFAPIYAGDRLTFSSHVEDVVQKRNGALTFIVSSTDVTNQEGKLVAEMRATLVVKRAEQR